LRACAGRTLKNQQSRLCKRSLFRQFQLLSQSQTFPHRTRFSLVGPPSLSEINTSHYSKYFSLVGPPSLSETNTSHYSKYFSLVGPPSLSETSTSHHSKYFSLVGTLSLSETSTSHHSKYSVWWVPCVRHVTGNDKDYLRKIPIVVW
jgi:hypothetical protein